MKKKATKKSESLLLLKRLSQPRYRGKHIVAIHGQVFTATKGDRASKLLDQLTRKYPSDVPTVTYIPKSGALVLLFPCKK